MDENRDLDREVSALVQSMMKEMDSDGSDTPALEQAIRSNRPVVIDVAMQNEPVPTAGHWNINDIYSPDREVSHVATEFAVAMAQ